MSEETWTARLKSKDDKRKGLDVEVNSTIPLLASDGFECMAKDCMNAAIVCRRIKKIGATYSTDIDLCAEHDDYDLAFEIYYGLSNGE